MRLGIAQRPHAALRRGRSSSRSRRVGGRSTIASPGAAASPASTDGAGGACPPRDASRPPSRAGRPPRRSSPPDRRRTAGRPSSGSAPARSDLHGRGVGGVWSPTRDQRRSWPRDDRPQGARRRARSTRRWRLRQRAVRCERRRHPTARVPPIPLVESSTIRVCSPWGSSGVPPVLPQDTPPPNLRQSACKHHLSLQRHLSTLTKFAHVESRFCDRKRRGKAALDVPVNPCVRSVCSRSVAVGLCHPRADKYHLILVLNSIRY